MPHPLVRQGRLLRQLTTDKLSVNSDHKTWRVLVAHHEDNGETTRQANDHVAQLQDLVLRRSYETIFEEEKNDIAECLWGTG